MSINQEQLIQAIYDLIYDSLTMAPPISGSQAATSASSTLMSLALPGLPLDPAEYANAWTPMNPTGDPVTAENFAHLVDSILEPSVCYLPNGQSVDGIYGQVVYANTISAAPVPPQLPVPPLLRPPLPSGASRLPGSRLDESLAHVMVERGRSPLPTSAIFDIATARRNLINTLPVRKQRAFNLLYAEETLSTPQGRSIKTFIESPVFRRYLDRRAVRDQFVTRYMTRYLQADLSNPVEKARWNAISPGLEAQLRSSERALQEVQAGDIEEAMTLTSSVNGQNNSVAAIFEAARLNYELSKLGSFMGPGFSWHMTRAQPQNWYASTTMFYEVDLQTDRALHINNTSRFPRLGGSAVAGAGLWQHGAPGHWTRQSIARDSVSVRVRFKFTRVNIIRSWFDLSLFSLGGWSLAGRHRNSLSTGSLTGNDGIFPLLPTSMILARDLQITASWSQEDVTFIRQRLAQNDVGLAFGPFVLAGRFQRSGASTSQAVNSTFDGTQINAPGLQIIGWISKPMPACPPLDS